MKAKLMKERDLSGKRGRQLVSGVLLAAAMSGAMSSCATPGKDTGIGAGAGAVGGAAIGGIFGGGKGALIGAGAGALLGGAVGNYLDKQAQQLAQVAATQRTQNGIMVNLRNDLLFDSGSAVLKPDAQTQLSQLGRIIARYPKDKIVIAGYTDNKGGAKLNQLLSQQRAQAVATALEQQGVGAGQVNVMGMGPVQPIANNKTAAGRARNRRVELKITVPS